MASPYTDERLIEILRDLARDLGKTPTTREMLARPDLPTPGTYVNRFGSWRAALARIDLRTRQGNTRYTITEMLNILRDLGAELGRAPSISELKRHRPDAPDPVSYANHFGSWNAALEAAGLEMRYRHTPAYTDERLIEILRDLARDLGKTPTRRELLARPGLPSPDTYRTHFGSWNAAIEAAGLKPNRRTPDKRKHRSQDGNR